MSFLVIAGQTIEVMEGQAAEGRERIGVQQRAFAGNLRTAIRVEKRNWGLTTALLLQADYETLVAATALGAHVACSGDALGGDTITCSVELGDAAYVSVGTTDGNNFMRSVPLTLREV